MKNKKYLLSIAIPTWNRAQTLLSAIEKLAPQIFEFKDEIQLVISDNASTDNTNSVILNFMDNYPEISLTHYIQKENMGFFGNFTKVKELSEGKYIWILSDDDHIAGECVKEIIYILRENKELGIIFLNDWKWGAKKNYRTEHLSILDLFHYANYRLTLISSVIFLNVKEQDNLLKKRFEYSNFIGFIYLVDMLSCSGVGAILYGNTLNVGVDIPKGYNWFQAFIIDINAAFDYMLEIGYPYNIVKGIKRKIYINLILYRYKLLKAFSKLDGGLETWGIKKVNKLIFRYYIEDIKSLILFLPLYLSPSLFIRTYINFKSAIKKQLKHLIKKG